MGKIRFCEECGAPLQPGIRFCENCGAPVPMDKSQEQPSRQHQQRAEDVPPRQYQRRAENVPSQQYQRRAEDVSPQQYQRRAEDVPSQQYQRRAEDVPSQQYQRRNENVPPYREEDRRRRYRQEELENDWKQSWDRMPAEEEDSRMTPIQYVLIGLTVILLIALIVFGVFWIMGRSSNKTSDERNAGQANAGQTNTLDVQSEGAIAILDDTATKTAETKTEETGAAETKPAVQSETTVQTEADNIVLNYSEFSVTLPGSWKGKYGITQSSNSYTFYQQASKAKGSGGILFTIRKYTDTSYKDAPDAQVLGTGNKAAFVFERPTDVQAAVEDPAAMKEYQEMAGDVDTIKANIKILVSGEGPAETEPIQVITQEQTQAQTQQGQSAGGYIPESSQRTLTDADVAGMSYDDMQMAINEIYARHGRKFADPNIQAYFNSQSWYQGFVEPSEFSDSVFSSVESQNIQFLLSKMGTQ
ncbi:MAG: YARHG domain-containing protein [Lachnospiraceae bacterium]|nr:YARHG domain-containing protein [Lachnospiraceae bacterium]